MGEGEEEEEEEEGEGGRGIFDKEVEEGLEGEVVRVVVVVVVVLLVTPPYWLLRSGTEEERRRERVPLSSLLSVSVVLVLSSFLSSFFLSSL